MDDWVAELQRGRSDAAWDLFLGQHRSLIFAALRHYVQDYDDVMDVFASACEALRANDFRRLRSWVDQPEHRAKFSTWLVTVVRHLAVDWFRHRDGRRRLSAVAEGLPPLRRRIFEHVFLNQRSHIEAYELIHAREAPMLSFREFLGELRATYRTVTQGRRGQLLRDLGEVPFAPATTQAEPVGPGVLEAGEQGQILQRALEALPQEDRLIIELYVLEELSAETVARVLGLPNPKAVYNRAYRALAMVREQLERSGIRREDL